MIEYVARKSTERIVVHCSDTLAGQDVGAAEIRGWHVNERHWIDIGYHLVVRRSGLLELGRPLWALGAHVEGFNHNSVGVCLVGGRGPRGWEDNFTPPQWSSLKFVVQLLRDGVYRGQITDICGHCDFPGVSKMCPSFDVEAWLSRERV